MILYPLLALTLMACEENNFPITGTTYIYLTTTPVPFSGSNTGAEYAAAQATLAAGQSEMMVLAHQATTVSLSENQAAEAAAQATADHNQRRLMELSIRSTEISQNMAQAAATQEFIAAQTQAAWNTAATAQSQAATATYAAYAIYVTQTAQAQVMLANQATQTSQEKAIRVAYSFNATPFAAIQSEIVRARDESNRRALWEEFVVTPLKVILFTLVVLLLIAGGVLAYQRLMPVLELRLRSFVRRDSSHLLLGDEIIGEHNLPNNLLPQQVLPIPGNASIQPGDTPMVEILGPSEPAVINWIIEAEQKLRSDRGIKP
jgi:hypothetical protein